MDDRENKFNYMVEQIRNFITHCLGFQPEDMTGGEFANDFTWKTNNSEFRIVAYYGCGWRKEPDYFDYYLTIDGKETNGTYSFGTQLTCEDENAIAKIIQPFKETVVNKTTLDVTTNIEQAPYTKRYYIIQVFIDSHWQDVLFSHGDLSTAEKKARHYCNQNDCETRVVEIKENISYSYDYTLVTKYDPHMIFLADIACARCETPIRMNGVVRRRYADSDLYYCSEKCAMEDVGIIQEENGK